jgi:hypothetical protein
MSSYETVRRQVESLTINDQLRLLEDLVKLIRQQTTTQPKHSILELRGLGKEIWQGMDAQTYVNQERDAWNG